MEALERLYPERLSEHVERLAHHASEAELWDRAALYLRQAATKAFARSANREAVIWFDQALTAIQRLPRVASCKSRRSISGSISERAAAARRVRVHPQAPLRSEALAAALPIRNRLGRVAAYLADYFRLTGDQDQALQWGKRALTVAVEIGDVGLQIVATTWLSQIHFAQADYGQAVTLLRRNLQPLVGELAGQRFGMPQPPAIHSRTCLAWCLAELGEFSEAIALGEEAVAMVGTVDHPLSRAVAHAGWAGHTSVAGMPKTPSPRSSGPAGRPRRIALLWFPRLASTLGSAYGPAGRLAEAVSLTEAAVAQGAAMNLMGGHSLLLTYLSEAYLLAGQHEDARQNAEQALELARAHKEPGYEGWALRLLAEIALAANPPHAARAMEFGHKALSIAEERGMRPLMAHCRLAQPLPGAGRRP